MRVDEEIQNVRKALSSENVLTIWQVGGVVGGGNVRNLKPQVQTANLGITRLSPTLPLFLDESVLA